MKIPRKIDRSEMTRGQEFNRNAADIWTWTMHEWIILKNPLSMVQS